MLGLTLGLAAFKAIQNLVSESRIKQARVTGKAVDTYADTKVAAADAKHATKETGRWGHVELGLAAC